jgi:DNA-binding MarR family transcriptional regulator
MIDLANPRHCVSNNLHRTTRAISRIYAEEMKPCGVKRSQFAILAHLEHLGVTQLTELADIMIMDRTTLSRNLKPLQNGGLVHINVSPTDARARELSLSKDGKAKFREAYGLWKKAQQRVLALFGEDNWVSLEANLVDLRVSVS